MTATRQGLTLIELLAVCAIVLILGMAIAPTLRGTRGDTQVQAGSDTVQQAIATARAKAIEDGKPYRLMVSTDGSVMQIHTDLTAESGSENGDGGGMAVGDDIKLPQGVTAGLVADDDMGESGMAETGWKLVATFLPDGTCREALNVLITVSEPTAGKKSIQLRGVTGASAEVKSP